MEPDTLTGLASVITAIGIPVVAYFTYLGSKATRANTKGISEVHGLVNSQNEALVAEAKAQTERIESLLQALNVAGIKVPEDRK